MHMIRPIPTSARPGGSGTVPVVGGPPGVPGWTGHDGVTGDGGHTGRQVIVAVAATGCDSRIVETNLS